MSRCEARGEEITRVYNGPKRMSVLYVPAVRISARTRTKLATDNGRCGSFLESGIRVARRLAPNSKFNKHIPVRDARVLAAGDAVVRHRCLNSDDPPV